MSKKKEFFELLEAVEGVKIEYYSEMDRYKEFAHLIYGNSKLYRAYMDAIREGVEESKASGVPIQNIFLVSR